MLLHKRQVHNLKHNKKLLAWWLAWWPAYGIAVCVAAVLSLPYGAVTVRADELTISAGGLPRIEAGTAIVDASRGNEPTGRWNRIVLLARPRIASGDVDALSTAICESISKFVLTIMAAVERTEGPRAGEPYYRLADVGLAYSTEVDGQLTTVTVAEAERQGVKLGFLARMMLAENEQQLKTAHITARTSTLMIFDVPALLLRGTAHRPYLMRHFVWIDPRDGRSSTLVWLVRQTADGSNSVELEEAPRWIPPGLTEDRAIHVDGSQFNLLGIPNKKAFAIEDLPPGKPLPWSTEAVAVAALKKFDVDSLRQLSSALNGMLRAHQ